MPELTLPNGTVVNLSMTEFMEYQEIVAPAPPVKTEAQQLKDALATVRTLGGSSGVEALMPSPSPQMVEEINDSMDLQEADEVSEAIVTSVRTGQPVEVNGCIVMDGKVLPKHIVAKMPKRIPFTPREMRVMEALRAAGQPMSSAQLMPVLPDLNREQISGHLSKIFQSGRGIIRGPHCTWFIEPWALRAEWFRETYPSNKWNQEKGTTS